MKKQDLLTTQQPAKAESPAVAVSQSDDNIIQLPKRYKKKWLLAILGGVLLLIAAASAGFLFVKYRHHNTLQPPTAVNKPATSSLTANLPACQGNDQLTVAPTSSTSFTNIRPLGGVNPSGDHVIPTDHTYFYLPIKGDPNNFNSPTIAAQVVAPADVTVVQIQSTQYTAGATTTSDYRVTFAPCRDLVFYYVHLVSLAPPLQAAVTQATNPNCQSGSGQKECSYIVSVPLKAGDLMGVAGGPGTTVRAFDFGAFDTRTQPLSFINKNRPPGIPEEYFYTVCPLNYYGDPVLKTSLFKRIQNTMLNSQGLPDCGSVMQDKAGTLQGNWYLQGSPDQLGFQSSDVQLAIIHLNTNPSIGTISVGGTTTKPGETRFLPASSGLVNREPSQITADGNIYCYQNNSSLFQNGEINNGHFVVQLTDNSTLKIEYGSGVCPSNPTFAKPTIYTR